MNWLLRRLSEPSTWAGLAIVAQGVSELAVNSYNTNAWGAVIGGLVSIVVKEKGGHGVA
jgi:hypothetical protein